MSNLGEPPPSSHIKKIQKEKDSRKNSEKERWI